MPSWSAYFASRPPLVMVRNPAAQHLVEPFEDASGDTGRLLVKPTGEMAQQPLGFISIVELPSLPERPAYRRMQRRGQPLDHVAGLMNLAALDGCVGTEGATDDFAQRFGAIDDEQPADLGIKPALDQVVDECLHDGGVLGCSFDQGERMFMAFSINAEGGDQHQVVANVQPVDLDDQEVQLGQV